MNSSSQRACPACNATKRKTQGHKNDFEIFVCRDCGTIYTSRVPEVHESQDYDGYYSESNLSVPPFVVERAREIVRDFSRFRQTNRFLDIGFGAGTILASAVNQKWEACGLEVSKPAFEQAKDRGFEVFYGSLAEAAYPDQCFDVVTASEILEHLPDPVADLKEIARILRPGGILWATTPSARSLSFRILGTAWSILSPPEHLQLYSKGGAALMLREAGFSEIRFQTFGLNPMEILHYFSNFKNSSKSFDRVATSYELNERLTKSRFRKGLKGMLNRSLNLAQLGDSLKIYARTNERCT